jgi:hypothetical protein
MGRTLLANRHKGPDTMTTEKQTLNDYKRLKAQKITSHNKPNTMKTETELLKEYRRLETLIYELTNTQLGQRDNQAMQQQTRQVLASMHTLSWVLGYTPEAH